MPDTSSQSSPWSQFHPAVLAVTGIAAGYGIYALYNAFSDPPPKRALSRRNAIRRPRRSQPAEPEATPQAARDSDSSNDAQPSSGSDDDARDRDSLDRTLDAFFMSCWLTVRGGDEPEIEIDGALVQPLLDAMRAGNEALISYYGMARGTRLGLEGATEERLAAAVARFLASPEYLRHTSTNPVETDAGGVAETVEDVDTDGNDNDPDYLEPGQGLRGLLYYIAEDDANRKAYEHRGVNCEECGELPIRGVRWRCLNCPSFDLCSTCEQHSVHPKMHVFAKIKVPLPFLSQSSTVYESWYPGTLQRLYGTLNVELRKRLCREHKFEEPQMDALFDQFVCLANVSWTADPCGLQAAIDMVAFQKAMTSDSWPHRYSPNLLLDRMFSFYDTNADGLIGFEEFVSGVGYLRGPKRFASLERALQGFDVDGDGYVSRLDFLRLLKAKFQIHGNLIGDAVNGLEHDQADTAMDVIRASQPISSIFSQEDIPPGDVRAPRGKQPDAFGDMQPVPGTKTILNNSDPWPDTGLSMPEMRYSRRAAQSSPEALRHHLSRFEENLTGSSEDEGNLTTQANNSSATSSARPIDNSHHHHHHHHHVSKESLGSQGSDQMHSRDSENFFDAMALWQIIEDGLNEVLDPLFDEQESEDHIAIESREERQTWRNRIDEAVRTKEEVQSELESAADADPLMATALKSTVEVRPKEADDVHEPAFTGEIIPTDAASLTQREEAIAQRPLEELLSASGYTIATENEPRDMPATVRSSMSISEPGRRGLDLSALDRSTALDDLSLADYTQVSPTNASIDPTLPQNRPNSLDLSERNSADEDDRKPSSNGAGSAEHVDGASERPPTHARLMTLAYYDEVDRLLHARGGAGRLSYLEVENLAVADKSGEIRGLIKSWLEWASF